jgi:hypothetical protein
MAHEVRTEIAIQASAPRVWQVLTDFAAYPQWNPFVTSIEGRPEKGQKLVVRIQPEGGRGMTFKPTVLAAEANRQLRWRGQVLLPGLFDGEHYFLVEPMPAGGTRFVHGERFSGLLVALAKSSLEQGARGGFIAMNRALKARAEGSA